MGTRSCLFFSLGKLQGVENTNKNIAKVTLSLHSCQVGRHQAGAYHQFQEHEVTRSISTPPWMGCKSITGLPPALNSLVPIYMAGGRETHVQPHFTSPSQRSLGTRNEGLWKQRIFQSKILGLTVFMYVIIMFQWDYQWQP